MSTPAGAWASTTHFPQPVTAIQPTPGKTTSTQASSHPSPFSSKLCGSQGESSSYLSGLMGGVSLLPAQSCKTLGAFSKVVRWIFNLSDAKTVNWKGRPWTKSRRPRPPSISVRPSSMWNVRRMASFFCGMSSFKSSMVNLSVMLPGISNPGMSTTFTLVCLVCFWRQTVGGQNIQTEPLQELALKLTRPTYIGFNIENIERKLGWHKQTWSRNSLFQNVHNTVLWQLTRVWQCWLCYGFQFCCAVKAVLRSIFEMFMSFLRFKWHSINNTPSCGSNTWPTVVSIWKLSPKVFQQEEKNWWPQPTMPTQSLSLHWRAAQTSL